MGHVPPKPTVWKPAAYHILQRTWGGETVVYHSGSGGTHLIDAGAQAVLASLGEAPASAPELYDRLEMASAAESREQALSYVERILEALYRLGLIEPENQY